jgi:hypothetical protein
MTTTELHDVLTAANPLPAERAVALTLDEAEDDLLTALLDGHGPGPTSTPRRRPHARRRRALVRLAAPIAATVVVLVALLSLRDGSGDGNSGTAWAAEQVRFAEASPLVLLDAPGWRVDYADEQSREQGELRFRLDARSAALNWRRGPIASWYEDRANSAAAKATAPVLGTTARVYQYEGGTPGHRDITALFRYDGRVLEFRAGAAGIDAFKELLAKLKRVDTDTWLTAMPASVVKTSDRDVTIRRMLQGVPVPPGFDPSNIRGADLTKDRYQLGAAVAGTVACQWFKRWADARRENDGAKEHAAVAAMATAKDWPVLNGMEEEGDYPEVLYAFAAAMRKGTWYGRPLAHDLNSGLGCRALGVDLR